MKKLLRILFSRYAVFGLLILLEVALVCYLVFTMSELSGIFLLITLAVSTLTLLFIINSDTNPEYKVTWIAIVLLVPTLGAVIYILLSRRSESPEDKKESERIIKELSMYNSDTRTLSELSRESKAASGRAVAIMSDDALAGIYRGLAKYYSSGEEMFSDMLRELSCAKSYIFLEYFIIDEGYMWESILDILTERAKGGVEIRLIYDDVGCAGRLPEGFDSSLRERGINVRRFGELLPRLSTAINNRDHRKLCIIDGKIAFTGGINIGDEYINKISPCGHWKDGGVSLFGAAVHGFLIQYLYVWGITDKSLEDYSKYLSGEDSKSDSGRCDQKREKNSAHDGGYYLTFGAGPMPRYSCHGAKRAITDMLSLANEYVYITTPYLIVDFDMTESLISAVKRGVDVRIITPRTADKRAVKIMTKGSYLHLLKNGVRIFEYQPGFMHEKLIVADGKYALVGTINLDYRSLAHHMENAVWCYGSPIIVEAKRDLDNIFQASREIFEMDAKLSPPELFVRCALRLFSPLF